jgi:hypothetical protein
MKRSSNLPEGQGTATSQKAIPNVGIQSSPNGLINNDDEYLKQPAKGLKIYSGE